MIKRSEITTGDLVVVNLRQPRGKTATGSVKSILTNAEEHPHGILVELDDGLVGRVQMFQDAMDSNSAQNSAEPVAVLAQPKTLSIQTDETGHSYDTLFGDYLNGASKIEIQDPYIVLDYQVRNLVDFCNVVAKHAKGASILLSTSTKDAIQKERQKSNLARLEKSVAEAGMKIKIDMENSFHDRCILIDDEWRIVLGRGLDIYQRFEPFSLEERDQSLRKCKQTSIDFIRKSNG